MAFGYWRERTAPKEEEQKIAAYEKMEKSGLINFETTTLKGEKISLDSFKGKIVILNFWASWCGPCVEEFPSMLKLADEMKGDLILVAVSGDSTADDAANFLKQFKDWEKPWIKVAWDQDHKLADLYDVDRLPESFISGTRLQLVKKISGSINWYTPESIEYIHEMMKK